ncbi:hypothetical protein LW33_001 [Lactococcus phage LW33]|uniref:Uncharacterized protein n=1 Tax=Lactococcus phage LW33 TaxID=1965480 RepID=A0A1W6JHV2_9CAUD|nr:hypothetical protein LW33_001 [Lactococcus phage LW33]
MTKKANEVLLTSQERMDINEYCDALLEVYQVTRTAQILVSPELANEDEAVTARLIRAVKDCKYNISNYDPTSHFVTSYHSSDITQFFIDKNIISHATIRKFAKQSEETQRWSIEKEEEVAKRVGITTTLGQQILFMSMIQSRVFVLWMNEFFIQNGSTRSRVTDGSLEGHLSQRYSSTGANAKAYEAATNTVMHHLKSLIATADLENMTLNMSVPKGWTPSTYQFNNGLLTFDPHNPELTNFDENVLDYRFAYQRVNDKFEAREKQYALIDNAINAISSRTNDLVPDDKVKRAHIFNWSLDALQDLTLPGRSACVFLVSPRNLNGGTGKSFMYRLIKMSLNKSVKISSYLDAVEQQRNHRSDLMQTIVGSLGFNSDEEQNFNEQALKDKFQFNDVSNKSLYYAPLGTNGSHHRFLGVHRSATNDLCWDWVSGEDTSILRRFWEDTYPAQVSSVEQNPEGTNAVKTLDEALTKGMVKQSDLLYYLYLHVTMFYGFTRNDYNFQWNSGEEILTPIGKGEIYFDSSISEESLAAIIDQMFFSQSVHFDKLLGGIPNMGIRSFQNQGVPDELFGEAGRYLPINNTVRSEFLETAKKRNLILSNVRKFSTSHIIDIALENSKIEYIYVRNSANKRNYLVQMLGNAPEAPTERSKALEQAKEEYVQTDVKVAETAKYESETVSEEKVVTDIDFEMKLTKLPSIYDNYNTMDTYVYSASDLVGKDVEKAKQEIVLVNDRFDRKDHSGTSNVLFLDFDDIADWTEFYTMTSLAGVNVILQESASSTEEHRKAHVFVPLAHPITADQYPVVQQAFINEFGYWSAVIGCAKGTKT